MYKLFDVANYIFNRYQNENNEIIDEMKLHKLLYFTQREAIIVNNDLLFEADFYGWKYGPVIKEVRYIYKNNKFESSNKKFSQIFYDILNSVFERYAHKSSWSLSRLTHGEYSWKESRKGIPDNINGDNIIKNSDIFKDAMRIKERMERFSIG